MNGSNAPVTARELYLVSVVWRDCKLGLMPCLTCDTAPHKKIPPTVRHYLGCKWSELLGLTFHIATSKHGFLRTPRKQWQDYTRDGGSQMLEGCIRVVGQNTLEPFLRLVFLPQPLQLLLLVATSVAIVHQNPGGGHHDADGRSGDHRNSAPADPPGLLHGTSTSSSPALQSAEQTSDGWRSQPRPAHHFLLTLSATDRVKRVGVASSMAIDIAEASPAAAAAGHKLHTTWLHIIKGFSS